ncbi:MAG: hypothetical protein KDI75_07580 [Xanthomonadales bacterium]|nr:hypothetical protein [Xanthomonadales bacterium]
MLISAILLVSAACAAVGTQKDSRDQSEATDVFERGCADDQGNNRCADEEQRKMRELYGIPDTEKLSEQGVALRRAMFVNGYGLDIVAITFSREPGRPPMVEVAAPRQEAGPTSQPLSAVVPLRTWNQILDASRDFDQQLARELPASGKGLENICLHSWFVVVEAVDPAHLSQRVVGQHEVPAKIRRDAEGACTQGLAMRYAFELARTAREQLPECSSLNVDDFRNDADLLSLCQRLGGDRIAASDAYRFLEELGRMTVPGPLELDPFELERFQWKYFARSSEQLAEPFIHDLNGANFFFAPPEATDLDHASVEGQAIFPDDENDQITDLKLKLVRQNREFVILSYELSEKRPYR